MESFSNLLKKISGVSVMALIGESGTGKSFKSKFTSALPLMCVVAYLLLGFLLDLWHPGWLVFLLIPILPTFFNVFSKNKKSSWMSLIVLLTVAIYLTVGFVFQLWHPNWIIFFIIPIASIFID